MKSNLLFGFFILFVLLLYVGSRLVPLSSTTRSELPSGASLQQKAKLSQQKVSSKVQKIKASADLKVDASRIAVLKTWVQSEALQMNRIQKDPAEIDQKIQQMSAKISKEEGLVLAKILQDSLKSQNERILILDLLTRHPDVHAEALVGVLSRTQFPKDIDLNRVQHNNPFQSFEFAVSVQAIKALEQPMLKDKNLQSQIEEILKTDIPVVVRSHLSVSLKAAKSGKMYWNERAASLTQGAM